MSARKRLPKEVQSMVDGGFNLLNIIVAIVVAVKTLASRLKKTDAEWTAAIHRLSQPEGADKIRAIAEIVLGVVTAPVVVIRRAWQDFLTACQQHWVHPDLTEARWPLEPVAADEAEWEVAEHFFGDDAIGEEKLRRLNEMVEMVEKGEIRLCGVRRSMEYVAAHPDVQLNHPLVVPVSAQDSGGHLCLPAFDSRWYGPGRCGLDLSRVSSAFGRHCGWLVLRKRTHRP